MNNDFIIENNKLIVKFMQVDDYEYDLWGANQLTEGLYHKSWDWLMPVFDKLIKLDFTYLISHEWCVIRGYSQEDSECITRSADDYPKGTTTLDLCYETMINFIKWYNKQ